MLVIDRRRYPAFRLYQVKLCDYLQSFAGQCDGARMDFFFDPEGLSIGQVSSFFVDPQVLHAPLDRIRAISKKALHPLVEEQPRAVNELVHHARRQIVRELATLANQRKNRKSLHGSHDS